MRSVHPHRRFCRTELGGIADPELPSEAACLRRAGSDEALFFGEAAGRPKTPGLTPARRRLQQLQLAPDSDNNRRSNA
jgi:hypothetical protein